MNLFGSLKTNHVSTMKKWCDEYWLVDVHTAESQISVDVLFSLLFIHNS
jgi:hypothetical protein